MPEDHGKILDPAGRTHFCDNLFRALDELWGDCQQALIERHPGHGEEAVRGCPTAGAPCIEVCLQFSPNFLTADLAREVSPKLVAEVPRSGVTLPWLQFFLLSIDTASPIEGVACSRKHSRICYFLVNRLSMT